MKIVQNFEKRARMKTCRGGPAPLKTFAQLGSALTWGIFAAEQLAEGKKENRFASVCPPRLPSSEFTVWKLKIRLLARRIETQRETPHYSRFSLVLHFFLLDVKPHSHRLGGPFKTVFPGYYISHVTDVFVWHSHLLPSPLFALTKDALFVFPLSRSFLAANNYFPPSLAFLWIPLAYVLRSSSVVCPSTSFLLSSHMPLRPLLQEDRVQNPSKAPGASAQITVLGCLLTLMDIKWRHSIYLLIRNKRH